MPSFAEMLLRLRQQAACSQSKLAQRAAIDHSMVSRYESEQRRVSQETVARIARALALDPSDEALLYIAGGYCPPRLRHDPGFWEFVAHYTRTQAQEQEAA